MLDLIQLYYHFNDWATGVVFESCEALTQQEYDAPGCSGNGSIGQTLTHAILVEQGWFAWFRDSIEMKDAVAIMTSKEFATLFDARDHWQNVVKPQTDGFIEQLSEDMLLTRRTFTRRNGKSESDILWKFMLHTANHGTHTRAQVVSAVRRFGHEPQNVDLLNYILNDRA